MTISLAPLAAVALVVVSGATVDTVDPQAVNDAVTAAVAIAQPGTNADLVPIRSGEGPTPSQDEMAQAIADMEQKRGATPNANDIDLTNAASSADGGAGKINNILALQRQGANFGYNDLKAGEKEQFAHSFDLTDAASSADGGAGMVMEINRLQASGVDILAR
jgi:hypothetical protein